MRLRAASLADVGLLRAWDEKPHVVASGGADDAFDWETEIPRRLAWRELLIGEEDERPIGFVQIIDPAEEETRYWGDTPANQRAIDIWIGEEADLGRGLGTEIMTLALERCFAPPAVTAVIIDPLAANPRAHRFYEKIGFTLVGPRRFGGDDCLVYRLDRAAWRRRRRS